ncbi:MAG: hypothetical protein LUI61_03435 [Firmicutes bacterium]|nr:hypothetical protein [Bacillota bacterium]
MEYRHSLRLYSLAFLFVAVAIVFAARLINIQIANRDYYSYVSTTTVTRTVTIQAQRGEIYDTNGTPLIVNSYSYSILLDNGTLDTSSNEAENENLLEIYNKILASDAEYTLVDIAFPGTGTFPEYTINEEFFESTSSTYRFTRLLSNAGIAEIDTVIETESHSRYPSGYLSSISSSTLMDWLYSSSGDGDATLSVSLDDIIETLAYRYGIIDSDGNALYDNETADFLLRLRYDMEARDFSTLYPYTLVTDGDIALVTYLSEGGLRGFSVSVAAERVYCEPGVASHILGRTGKIQSDDVEYYTELGYSLDAIVGVSGVELTFEEYLHGEDGEMTITEDEYGNIISMEVTTEPVAGYDVYLTIDIDLQKAAEQALVDNIEYIHTRAEESNEELYGEDANAGAISVLDVKTGAVLALASYPTYDLSTFSEDAAELYADENAPLYNRALNGTYAPGSTFKPAVAAAALTEGIVTEDTLINDTGIYEYYADSGFTPRCWLYVSYGRGHGNINISEAIRVSCNYFFYELGRLLTIEVMNKYCKSFGLGESTGIELSESTGVLAGPDYREENGLDAWAPGDTLTAAIGQSDNLFTPLQLSVYMAALINCGTRYNAHILDCVKEFGTGNIIYSTETYVMSEIEISEDNVQIILDAMQTVIESGTTATLFDGYPIEVGGKTGTAQVGSTGSANAVFIGFAPFDDPEIVATCIIEHGATGAYAGLSVRDVFTEYFDLEFTSGSEEENDILSE